MIIFLEYSRTRHRLRIPRAVKNNMGNQSGPEFRQESRSARKESRIWSDPILFDFIRFIQHQQVVKYCKIIYRNITILTFWNIFEKKWIFNSFRNIVGRFRWNVTILYISIIFQNLASAETFFHIVFLKLHLKNWM